MYCYEDFLDKGPSIKPGSIYSIMTTMRETVVLEGRKRRIYTAAEMLALPPNATPWIVDNMIPCGGRVMLYGQGSSYKTMFVFDLAVSIACGMDILPGVKVKKAGRVLLVSTEATLNANRKRLEYIVRARDVLPQKLQLYYCQDRYTFNDRADIDSFLEDMDSIDPMAVILDPLVNFVGGDENSAKETEPFRKIIDAIITARGTTFIILHHEGVSGKGRPRGTSAWHGWLDSELQFVKSSITPSGGTGKLNLVEVTATKMRDGVEDKLLTLIPIYNEPAKTIGFKAHDPKLQDSLYQITDKLLACRVISVFAPITTTDAATRSGISYQRMRDALSSLQTEGVVDKLGTVLRDTSPDGSRRRTVSAWKYTDRISQVDAYLAMMRAKQQEIEDDLRDYFLDPSSATAA